jgi:8-oxo-dGTP pyrophosphatase MutT (NUDIX family)
MKGAGVILFNSNNELCIVKGRDSNKYSLPKGKSEYTDTCAEQTALRECYEETGLRVTLGTDTIKLGPHCYYIVRMRDRTGYEASPRDTNEICEVKWVSYDELRNTRPERLNQGLNRLVRTLRMHYEPR